MAPGFSFLDFLNESSDEEDKPILEIGSYVKRYPGDFTFKTLVKSEDNDMVKDQPDLNLSLINDGKMIGLSYMGNSGAPIELQIPSSALDIQQENGIVECISFINDSKWVSNEKNLDSLCEFLEGYLNSRYSSEEKELKESKEWSKSEAELILMELGFRDKIENAVKSKDKSKAFEMEGGSHIVISFKSKGKSPKKLSVYRKKEDLDPFCTIQFGSNYIARIYDSGNTYYIKSDTLSEISENPVFSIFVAKNVDDDDISSGDEGRLIELLKTTSSESRKDPSDKSLSKNITFLKEIIKRVSDIKDIDSLLRKKEDNK